VYLEAALSEEECVPALATAKLKESLRASTREDVRCGPRGRARLGAKTVRPLAERPFSLLALSVQRRAPFARRWHVSFAAAPITQNSLLRKGTLVDGAGSVSLWRPRPPVLGCGEATSDLSLLVRFSYKNAPNGS